MSNINFSEILTDYPVAGQDNDSQGFRDNFSAIYNAFEVAKAEIGLLQTNSVLKATIDGENDPVVNDLNGSSIVDGYHNNFHGTSYTNTVSGPTAIDVRSGSLQNFIISNNIQFNFTNWPASGYFGKVTIHLSNASEVNLYSATFTQSAGTIRYDGEFPTPLQVSLKPVGEGAVGEYDVVEAWTYTGGSTVFLKYLGKFTDTASNNRSVTGTLTVAGATTLAGASATSLTVSGSTSLASTTASSLSVSNNATVNGALEVQGNSVLGNSSTVDKVTFNSVPVFPSLTTTQRDSLISLVGMVIFNTTDTKLQVCTVPGTGGSATWVDL